LVEFHGCDGGAAVTDPEPNDSDLAHTRELADVIDHWVTVMSRWVANLDRGEPGTPGADMDPGRELSAASE
jgi:hypothetical protein